MMLQFVQKYGFLQQTLVSEIRPNTKQRKPVDLNLGCSKRNYFEISFLLFSKITLSWFCFELTYESVCGRPRVTLLFQIVKAWTHPVRRTCFTREPY